MNLNIKYSFALFVLVALSFSCKKFVELDLPKSQILAAQVFESDITATAAMTGIYHDLSYEQTSFASGYASSVAVLTGLSSDELLNYTGAVEYKQFEFNSINADNFRINELWSSMYKAIYGANAMIEGINASKSMTQSAKKQLRGEALFVRAFGHFYLLNLFGDVPIVLTSDYTVNAKVKRMPQAEVKKQIYLDLAAAIENLPESYITTERVRPNKYTAMALLSRAYLYNQDWQNAENTASKIIGHTELYGLEELDNVFLANSREAIWQLMPVNTDLNATGEGSFFIIDGYIENMVLRSEFNSQFEVNDQRKEKWIGTFDDGTGPVNFPYKYKVKYGTEITEYSMIFRLAEQFLIRAEARAHLNKLEDAKDDLFKIRDRAGLGPSDSVSQANIILAIEVERRSELFSEWGHRWFDLKRWGKAVDILRPYKNGITINDTLYPLPQTELARNKNLAPQNLGY